MKGFKMLLYLLKLISMVHNNYNTGHHGIYPSTQRCVAATKDSKVFRSNLHNVIIFTG